MKKAAKRKVSRSVKTKSKPQNSLLLLAILIIAVVGITVWAVIANNPGKTPFALTPLPPSPPPALALTVNWKMPVGYALFRDVGNKRATCQVVGITCSTPTYTYWPGSKVNYTVAVKSINGPVLQTGSTVATSDGRAVANWNWRYEVNAFPDSFGSCAGAGVKCVKGNLNNNNLTVSYIAQNLLPSTLYRMIVCAPACAGGMVIQNTTAKTADVTTSWILREPIVNGNSVSFAFSPASNGNMALIVKNASTGAVVFDSGVIPSGSSTLQWNAQSGNYQAVLVAFGITSISNTVVFSVSGIVASPSPTTQPIISCSQVDFDHDGSVSILDLTLMSKAYGTKVGDPNFNDAYDLNHDGTITKADMDIASGFFGQKC